MNLSWHGIDRISNNGLNRSLPPAPYVLNYNCGAQDGHLLLGPFTENLH